MIWFFVVVYLVGFYIATAHTSIDDHEPFGTAVTCGILWPVFAVRGMIRRFKILWRK